jgi:hypothetical protein
MILPAVAAARYSLDPRPVLRDPAGRDESCSPCPMGSYWTPYL